RDRAWVAREGVAVEVGGDGAGRRAHAARAERLAPDVEVVAERVGALDRRLDVDDPVARVAVQPVEARSRGDEGAFGCLLLATGRRDPDALRDHTGPALDEYREVRVDVEEHLLAALASDAVDRTCRRLGGRGREHV